jgi:hypothetical protein
MMIDVAYISAKIILWLFVISISLFYLGKVWTSK